VLGIDPKASRCDVGTANWCTRIERRRYGREGFDIDAALRAPVRWFPSKQAMLVLLESWLYAGEEVDGAYLDAVSRGLAVMKRSGDVATAIAVLRRRLQS
jgi:hypothetical protein